MSTFWYTASAVPRYHSPPVRCEAGSTSMNSPSSLLKKLQPRTRWRIRECALYCVSTPMRRTPEFTQFESGKSIRRNLPPNGTAGFARQVVSS